jgi:regulator of replication initiation timing
MKSYFVLIVFMFLGSIGFSQSKKELQQQVTTLTSEKQKLMGDVLDLKQQMLDLKTQVLDLKNENAKLQNELASRSTNSTDRSDIAITKPSDNSIQTTGGRCQAITAKGTQCTRQADPGSKYCWQHKKTYEPQSTSTSTNNNSSVSSPSSSGSSTSGGRTIYTGSRGGQYYINSHGNKTYVKH